MSETLGQHVQRLRKARGRAWSQRELARRAGVSSATISRLESDKEPPKPETLKKIAPFLKTTAEDLLRRAGVLEVNAERVADDGPVRLAPADVLSTMEDVLLRGGCSEDVVQSFLTLAEVVLRQAAPTPAPPIQLDLERIARQMMEAVGYSRQSEGPLGGGWLEPSQEDEDAVSLSLAIDALRQGLEDARTPEGRQLFSQL